MIEILNAYKAPRPTKKSIAESALYYGYSRLLDEKGVYNEKIYWNNVTLLGYVEIKADSSFDIMKLTASNDQAPYLEVYLDEHDDEVIYSPSCSSKIQVGSAEDLPETFRVLFFIHLLHDGIDLIYDGRQIRLPEIQKLPENLKEYARYIPVG